MIAVIDTNILLVSLPSRSKYRPIFDAYLKKKITLVITTDIFLEYFEVLQNLAKKGVAEYVRDTFINSKNILTPEVYYFWNLITADPDDNKFTDAYIAANASFLVTNDSHFNELKKGIFPPVNVVTADEFLNIVKGL